MEKLIEMVAEKTGLPADKAQAAVEAVLGYLKENPDQVKGLVGLEGDDLLGQAKERLGDVGEKLGDVGEKAKSAVGRLLKR
jgi:hypothetical protein